MIAELKQERKLGRRCRCRTCPYLNNVVEQDHRGIKRRVNASQGFRSFDGAWRTIQGYEVLHMIRKGQVRWLPKGDVLGQIQFIRETLGIEKLNNRNSKRLAIDSVADRIVFATHPFQLVAASVPLNEVFNDLARPRRGATIPPPPSPISRRPSMATAPIRITISTWVTHFGGRANSPRRSRACAPPCSAIPMTPKPPLCWVGR